MTIVTRKFGMGASVLRKEDDAFLAGKGRFTDDFVMNGMLHGIVVRSPVAKARFTIGSLDEAKAVPGVRLILTGDDVAHLKDLKVEGRMPRQPDGTRAPSRDIPILCRGLVQYVGDAVAFIVADSKSAAQDAIELIDIAYEDEAPAIFTATALEPETPLVWPELGTNQAFLYRKGDEAKTDTAFEHADHRVKIAFQNNRLVANYMETRAAIGEWRTDEDRFVLTCGSQGVHSIQDILADSFGLPKEQMRVITPDVGGGFGTKSFAYREYVLVLEAAKRLGQPVKWLGDRNEHFLTDSQGRDNWVTAEMALDKTGRFLGLRVELLSNLGAYVHQGGPMIAVGGITMTTGVYDLQAIDVTVKGVYTNTCPVDAYRGAGRPEAAFLIEKLVDECARQLNMPREDIRRRNFIKPEQFPYQTPGGRRYDVCELDQHMSLAMERADWNSFDERAEEAKKRGKLRGIGMATYIEACAFAGNEPAYLTLETDGTVTLAIGTQSNGQGHATAYAQLVAEKLNVDIAKVNVHQGDTDVLAAGGGTGGSRSVPLGGVSSVRAAEDLALKIRKIAADEFEASPHDVELVDGVARIVGTDRALDFAAIAGAAQSPVDIKGFGEFMQPEPTYPNGTHICEVEIDPETGMVNVVGYTVVDDFGETVNPILLEGQVHGGIIQGVGQALVEDTVYSEDGQLITATFQDYAMPRADMMPMIHFETRNVPSNTNALGMKGAGEAGTIGSTPATLNAVVDALWRGFKISHIEMPATPQRVWQAIRAAKTSA